MHVKRWQPVQPPPIDATLVALAVSAWAHMELSAWPLPWRPPCRGAYANVGRLRYSTLVDVAVFHRRVCDDVALALMMYMFSKLSISNHQARHADLFATTAAVPQPPPYIPTLSHRAHTHTTPYTPKAQPQSSPPTHPRPTNRPPTHPRARQCWQR